MLRNVLIAIGLLALTAMAAAQGTIQERQDALRAAKSHYETAESNSSVVDAKLAEATFNYGLALLQAFDAKESRKFLELALERYEAVFGAESPKLVGVLLLSAQADYAYGRAGSSKRNLEHARNLVAKSFDNSSLEYADFMHHVGTVALTLQFIDDALDDLTAAHDVYSATLDPMSTRLGKSSHFLGTLYLADGRPDEAASFFEAALTIFDASDPTRLDDHIQVLADWGEGLFKQGMEDEATSRYRQIGRLKEHVTTDVQPIRRVAPRYPTDALRRGKSGFVEWQFTVDEDGLVVNPEVVRREGPKSFEKASLDALKQFRYVPRFVDGKAVAIPGVTSVITFKIER